jgi:hypothetical protein
LYWLYVQFVEFCFMKINSGFSNLSEVNFAAQVDLIITSLTGNANFPEPWAATVPTLVQLQTDQASYQSALNAIAAGDRRRVADRDAGRQKLTAGLVSLAYYLQTLANGDATKLSTTGFTPRKSGQRVLAPLSLQAPDGTRLERSILSGQIVIKARSVNKAASYDVQIATADPTVEANWSDAGSYTSCRRIELGGLTPGKIYWVRLRALGVSGPGAWTPAASLMVV